MKQRLTLEEYSKEPKEIRQKWHEWASSKGHPPRPNIGTMIEFLSDSFKEKTNVFDLPSIREGKVDQHAICDFLWGAVKEVLEK